MRRGPAAIALAVAAGLAGYAAHPPVGAWWLTFLVVPLLVAALAVDAGAGHTRRAGRLGAIAGVAMFAPMLTWLILPAGFVGWVLLSLVMAAWVALAAWAIAPSIGSPWLALTAPVVWVGIESWRGTVPFGGFEWGTLGFAHPAASPFLDVARVAGAAGVSFVVVAVGALVVVGLRHRWALLVAAAVVVLVVVAPPAAPAPTGETVDVLAVQGNDLVGPVDSVRGENLEIAENLLAETAASVEAAGRPDLTIWPESSIDDDPFARAAYLLPIMETAARLVGGDLLVGVNLDVGDDRFANTALLLDADGEVADRYTKRRYVPFGEYIPFREQLDWIPPLRQVPRDGVPGAGPQVVRFGEVTAAVLICFETLFEDVVRENVLAGDDTGIVLAITNDASFGRDGVESDQHIAQSRTRAVETGRWVVHTALSGGSALLDPEGRIHASTGLFERATIRADVPVITTGTPYLRAGDVVGTGSRWAIIALAAFAFVRRRRHAASDREAV